MTDAYFAKKEYTKKTDEISGIHKYEIKNYTKQKSKKDIASEIAKIVNPLLLKDKKYAKEETIIEALQGNTPFDAGKKRHSNRENYTG